MQNTNLNHVGNTPIQILKYLDAGSFSQVFLCQTPSSVAVLKITSSQAHMKSITKELDLLRKLNSTNNDYLQSFLVKFIDGESNNNHACLLLEYCRMNLVQYMNTQLPNQLPLTNVLHILYDVVQGLYFLHANNIIHRDIKLENVLLKEPGNPSNQYTPSYCLCDFGSCTTQSIPYNTLPQNINDLKYDIESSTTLQYRSPEMIDLHLKRGLSTKLDIWALGCLLFKLLYYKNPFDNEYAILSWNNNMSQLLSQTNKSIPPQVKTLLEKCLWVNPLERWNSWCVLNQLCEIKGSTCPLQNVFKEEVVQGQILEQSADKTAHPLVKVQQQPGLVQQQVGMSDMAQQRRTNRGTSRTSNNISNNSISGLEDPIDQSQFQQPQYAQQLQQPQQQQQLDPFGIQPQYVPASTVSNNSNNPSHFPTLEEFEFGGPQPQIGQSQSKFPDLTTFEQGNIQIPSNEPAISNTLSPIANTPRKTSLKQFKTTLSPSMLVQNVIKSVDLTDVGILLKWSWQRYHLRDDPISAILTEIRQLMGQIGVVTTNVRSVFRGCMVLHALLLYGPQDVPNQLNLENVLQSLESVQNRMSSFYARYLREYCAFLQKYELSGRYRPHKPPYNPIVVAKYIVKNIQIHIDKFLNVRDSMGVHTDIALCLYLFIQDCLMALSSVVELGKGGKTR